MLLPWWARQGGALLSLPHERRAGCIPPGPGLLSDRTWQEGPGAGSGSSLSEAREPPRPPSGHAPAQDIGAILQGYPVDSPAALSAHSLACQPWARASRDFPPRAALQVQPPLTPRGAELPAEPRASTESRDDRVLGP